MGQRIHGIHSSTHSSIHVRAFPFFPRSTRGTYGRHRREATGCLPHSLSLVQDGRCLGKAVLCPLPLTATAPTPPPPPFSTPGAGQPKPSLSRRCFVCTTDLACHRDVVEVREFAVQKTSRQTLSSVSRPQSLARSRFGHLESTLLSLPTSVNRELGSSGGTTVPSSSRASAPTLIP